MSQYAELRDLAVTAAQAGAAVLCRFQDAADAVAGGGAHLEVRRKATNDFVTEADRESEEAVVAAIRRNQPSHRILAEEGGELAGGEGDYQWLIDPLDGTTNFMQGMPFYCVSVACRHRDRLVAAAILDPLRGDLFSAAAGAGAERNGKPISVSRQAGLDGAFLATGFPFRAHTALDRYLGAFSEVFRQARAIRRCGAAALDLAYTAAGVFDGFFEFRLSPWDIGAGALLISEAGGLVSDLDGGDRYLEGGNVVAGGPGVQPALLAAVARHADEATMDRAVPLERADLAVAETAEPVLAGERP